MLIDHQYFMHKALQQADLAEQAGEVPVGAVLVSENEIIAMSYNQNIHLHDPSAHAEILVLRAAGQKCRNHRLVATRLYVTLEPCLMCVGAMVHARIDEVIFGASDPKTGACGSVIDALNLPVHNHRLRCSGGILSEACSQKLKMFFKARR